MALQCGVLKNFANPFPENNDAQKQVEIKCQQPPAYIDDQNVFT